MIYEAKVLGASAVLLICSILTEEQIRAYLQICDDLGLSALVETHDEAEVETALRVGARVIGVNNRNLKDFTVDPENSRRLRAMIPKDVVFVSESGVTCPKDVENLRQMGADAVLIGETLMRATDKTGDAFQIAGDSMTKIKLCGLTAPAILSGQMHFARLHWLCVCKKSRRYVSPEQAKTLKSLLRPEIQAVGVFVNEPVASVAALLSEGVIDVAQLHGQEDDDYIRQLRAKTEKPLFQAFRVDNAEDVLRATASLADQILLDSGAGGTGASFDWSLLKTIERPYFLAGGLNETNIA